MKQKLLSLLGMICVCVLTGCNPVYEVCGNQTECWHTFYNNSRCQTCIRHTCDPSCDRCIYGGPACQACWACIDHNRCKTDGVPIYPSYFY